MEGLEGLSVEALRAMRSDLVARITELKAIENRSIAESRELGEAVKQANTILGLIVDATEAETTEVAVVDQAELADAVAAAAALQSVTDRPIAAPVAPQSVAPVAVVASAYNQHGSASAMSLADIGHVANDLFTNGRTGKREHIVTFRQEGFAPVVAAANGPLVNTRAITDFLASQAVTAAPFNTCGPPDILRNVVNCDNDMRYVANWFTNVPSEHGSIQYYRPFGMDSMNGSTAAWGEAEQSGVDDNDPDTWKPCVEVGCLTHATCGVEAVPQCVTMKTIDVMTSPEAVASMLAAARAYLARNADGQLLSLLDAQSSKYTFDGTSNPLGAKIKVYDALGRLMGMAAAANRQLNLSDYTLGVEAGFVQQLMLDDVSACDQGAATEAAIDLFRGLGVRNVVVTPDWSSAAMAGPYSSALPINPPSAAPIAIPARPTDYRIRLFRREDYALLTPGGETFGIVPDLANKRKNKVTWFGELFQGLCKVGCGLSFSVDFSNLCATGARGACVSVPCP
jgi:hypothetical protein